MLQDLDFSVLYWIQDRLRCGLMDWTMPKLTLLGEAGAIWIALALVLFATKKYRRCGLMLAAGLLCSLLLGNLLLKPLVARPRPCWLDPSVPLLVAVPKDCSFPSGHSLSAFITVTVLWRQDRRLGIPALILSILLAFSRLYLFVHFPSDVLAGILLGMAVGLGVCFLADRFFRRREDWV